MQRQMPWCSLYPWLFNLVANPHRSIMQSRSIFWEQSFDCFFFFLHKTGSDKNQCSIKWIFMVLHSQSFCPRVCYSADCQYDVLNSTVTCSVWSGYLQLKCSNPLKSLTYPKDTQQVRGQVWLRSWRVTAFESSALLVSATPAVPGRNTGHLLGITGGENALWPGTNTAAQLNSALKSTPEHQRRSVTTPDVRKILLKANINKAPDSIPGCLLVTCPIS